MLEPWQELSRANLDTPEPAAAKRRPRPEPIPDLEPPLGRWWILTDVSITRRKKYHVVITPEGKNAFQSRELWDCVEYLDAKAVEAYSLRPSEPLRSHQVEAIRMTKETPTWQS